MTINKYNEQLAQQHHEALMEIDRLKRRVRQQHEEIEKLMDTIDGMYDEIEALENDNADLKSALETSMRALNWSVSGLDAR